MNMTMTKPKKTDEELRLARNKRGTGYRDSKMAPDKLAIIVAARLLKSECVAQVPPAQVPPARKFVQDVHFYGAYDTLFKT